MSAKPFACWLLAVAALLSGCASPSTACLERTFIGDVRLDSEAIEEGQALRYQRIDGSLTISGVPGSALSMTCLHEVSGSISVLQNPVLRDLDLPQLVSAGALLVMHNGSLRSLRAPLLGRLDAELRLDRNPFLESARFPTLSEVRGSVVIANSGALHAMDLPALSELGGELWLHHNGLLERFSAPLLLRSARGLRLLANPALTQLELPALSSLGKGLSLLKEGLSEQLSLPSLSVVVGPLMVEGNSSLVRLDLPQMTQVEGDLVVRKNERLQGLVASSLDSAESVEITANHALETLELHSLRTLSGYLLVSSPSLSEFRMPELESVSLRVDLRDNLRLAELSLPSLQGVGQGLLVVRNPQLEVLGLEQLRSVEWSLDLVECGALRELNFPQLERLGRGLSVLHNARISSLLAPRLVEVGGDLLVRDNAALSAIDLAGLRQAGDGQVLIAENPMLAELSMPSLSSLPGTLAVHHNRGLSSLQIPQLTEVGRYLSLRHNSKLSTLQFTALSRIARHVELRALPALSRSRTGALRALVDEREEDLAAPAPIASIEPDDADSASQPQPEEPGLQVAGAGGQPPSLEQLREANAKAREHLDAGRFAQARTLAEETIARAGSDEESRDQLRDTRKVLSRAMDELGDGAAAEQGLKLALAHEDAGHWNCAYQALGVLYSKAGDLGGGHSRPVDLSAPPEHDADANFRAALRYAEAHRNKDALRLVERALAVEAKPRFMALQAFLLVGAKNYEMARPLFAQAAQSLPRDPGPAVGRGHLLVVAQDYEAAKREFDVGLARLGATSMREVHGGYLDFVEGMARLGLGWLHANQDQHVLALTHFDAILEHRPDDLLANLGRGNSLMGLDDLDGAQQQLRRVLQINPGNPYARSELASIDLARGDVAAAEEGFRAALEAHDAGYTCPYEGLGLVYLRQGRVKEAQANFEKAISLNPDIEYKKFNGLARIYMQDGRLDEAEQLLRRSMRNFPHDGKAAAMLVELERLREESHR